MLGPPFQCTWCTTRSTETNPRPVIQCPKCGLVWITKLCSMQDGGKADFQREMQREFGRQFRYVIDERNV